LTTAAAVLGALLVVGSIGIGVYLWIPARHDLWHRGGLGAALIGGAIVALAIFLIQIVIDERRQHDSAQQNLRLTLGLAKSLVGIDLSHADLDRMYLADKNLSRAQLVDANLSHAYLSGATLTAADLSDAKLNCTNLNLARVGNAKFINTKLGHASLIGVHGQNTKFFGADLRGADLSKAVLPDAIFVGADLSGADLSGADLRRADLTDATVTDIEYDGTTTWPAGYAKPPSHPADRPRGDPCK
jgi:uncharacterized protein YjbI with pentapeptide repeats